MSKLLSRASIFLLLAALLPVASARAELPQPSILLAIMSTSPVWTTYGTFDGAQYGYSVASIGDFDNDTYDDVIVGAYKFKVSTEPVGSAFIFRGSQNGLSEIPFAQLLDPGLESGSNFGYAVAGAGDVNNDGYDDIIVGAPSHHEEIPPGQGDNGAAYLYLGSTAGTFNLSPAWSYVGPANSEFGASVAGIGDVNNDGCDDVLIGAVHYTNGQTNEGAVYLFLGSEENGLQAAPVWMVESNIATAQLGYDITGIGDSDHDTYADFAVSAPTADSLENGYDSGFVWVFYGSATVPDTLPDWTAIGTQAYAQFGFSIDNAGDVDNNGYADLIIGANGYDGNLTDQLNIGAAFVYLNNKSGTAGLNLTPDWMVTSDQVGSNFGMAVAGIGDANMDGYDDVAVGAPDYTIINDDHKGTIFVFSGSTSGPSVTPNWSASGKAKSKFGYSLAAAGDVNHDLRADLIVGAPDYMRDDKTKMGAAFVFHGMATGDLPVLNFHVFLPIIVR